MIDPRLALRIKKAWAESVEKGTAFANPVQEKVLRWRS